MEKLRNVAMSEWLLIEQHLDGSYLVGKVGCNRVIEDGSLELDWRTARGQPKRTIFRPRFWQCETDDEVVFLRRIGAEGAIPKFYLRWGINFEPVPALAQQQPFWCYQS